MFLAWLVVASQTTNVDVTSLIQYGVLGVMFIAMVFGKIVPGYILEEKNAQISALQAENREMRITLETNVIPTLTRSTDLLAQVANVRFAPTAWQPPPQGGGQGSAG